MAIALPAAVPLFETLLAQAALLLAGAAGAKLAQEGLATVGEAIDQGFSDTPPAGAKPCPATNEEAEPVPCFNKPDGVGDKEFEDQIKEQEKEINNLSPDEFLKRRASYKTARRPEVQKAAREKYRNKKYQEYLEDLLSQDIDLPDAKQRAGDLIDSEMKTLDATHKLDLVAGGDPNQISENLGDRTANRSIGRQWVNKVKGQNKSKVDILDDIAKDAQKSKKPKMRVKLSVCK